MLWRCREGVNNVSMSLNATTTKPPRKRQNSQSISRDPYSALTKRALAVLLFAFLVAATNAATFILLPFFDLPFFDLNKSLYRAFDSLLHLLKVIRIADQFTAL